LPLPRLTAELYRAVGEIPGVTVDTHTVGVAGRPGIGFLHSVQPAAGAEEVIIDPHTYRLMGTGTWGRPSLGVGAQDAERRRLPPGGPREGAGRDAIAPRCGNSRP
jgi:hypothetical protein